MCITLSAIIFALSGFSPEGRGPVCLLAFVAVFVLLQDHMRGEQARHKAISPPPPCGDEQHTREGLSPQLSSFLYDMYGVLVYFIYVLWERLRYRIELELYCCTSKYMIAGPLLKQLLSWIVDRRLCTDILS